MTDLITKSQEALTDSLANLVEQFVNFIPDLFLSLILLLLGIFIAGLLRSLTKRILKALKFNNITKAAGINKLLNQTSIDESLFNFIPEAIYWIVMLTFILAISNILNLTAVTDTIGMLIAYIPNIIAAVIIFVITLAAGQFAYNSINGMLKTTKMSQYSGYTSFIVQAAVIIFGSLVALSQLGLNVEIINTNLTLIVGGIVAALAISLGLGGKTVAHNILASIYLKNSIKKGDIISAGEVSGKVVKCDNIGVTLSTKQGDVTVKYKDIV